MYLDDLKFCVVCINTRRYVCCSECYVVSNGVCGVLARVWKGGVMSVSCESGFIV